MNIIVTNKYRDLIYSTNIEVLKELNGVYKVNQIVNSFKSVFYKKIIIDATSLQDFPKGNVLKELASNFELDKLILFLPPDNPPPKNFLSFLVNLKIYNFTDNPKGLIKLVQKSNTYEDVSSFVTNNKNNIKPVVQEPVNNEIYTNNGRLILGISSVQKNNYSTKLVYMLKKQLEFHKKSVLAVELDKRDFNFYRSTNMESIPSNRIRDFLSSNSNYEIVLIDSNSYLENYSNDVIYLLDPSLFEINKLLYTDRMVFQKLKGKKIVFVNSLLSDKDVEQFAREAGISVYYNLPPLNDRKENEELDKFLVKLGILTDIPQTNTKRGLFDIFK